jgi:hypothetical protein
LLGAPKLCFGGVLIYLFPSSDKNASMVIRRERESVYPKHGKADTVRPPG